jgi:hypothetical protein
MRTVKYRRMDLTTLLPSTTIQYNSYAHSKRTSNQAKEFESLASTKSPAAKLRRHSASVAYCRTGKEGAGSGTIISGAAAACATPPPPSIDGGSGGGGTGNEGSVFVQNGAMRYASRSVDNHTVLSEKIRLSIVYKN